MEIVKNLSQMRMMMDMMMDPMRLDMKQMLQFQVYCEHHPDLSHHL
jgi:hypothetical protein